MLKKILPWTVFILMFILLIMGYAAKDTLNNYLSETLKNQASPEINRVGTALVDSLYNYSKNGQPWEVTFLEFGAKGCSACKRMESVLEEIKTQHATVNVVFMNVLQPESQSLMKHFGIAVIPTQVLLDKNGREFFRHSGYYSVEELEQKLTLAKI